MRNVTCCMYSCTHNLFWLGLFFKVTHWFVYELHVTKQYWEY